MVSLLTLAIPKAEQVSFLPTLLLNKKKFLHFIRITGSFFFYKCHCFDHYLKDTAFYICVIIDSILGTLVMFNVFDCLQSASYGRGEWTYEYSGVSDQSRSGKNHHNTNGF